MFCSSYETEYGTGFVITTEREVLSVGIPGPVEGITRREEYAPCPFSELVSRMLVRYFSGVRVDFTPLPVVLDHLSPFRQQVVRMTRQLGYGDICSYGQLAARCGIPRGARAVGGALGANPIPVIIPCHRVVAANGMLTGFSAPGGIHTKRRMLLMEGAEFKGMNGASDRVVMNRNNEK